MHRISAIWNKDKTNEIGLTLRIGNKNHLNTIKTQIQTEPKTKHKTGKHFEGVAGIIADLLWDIALNLLPEKETNRQSNKNNNSETSDFGIETSKSPKQHIPKKFPSILLIGSPGAGKTTLLRDCCRLLSEFELSVVVVDSSNEIGMKRKRV